MPSSKIASRIDGPLLVLRQNVQDVGRPALDKMRDPSFRMEPLYANFLLASAVISLASSKRMSQKRNICFKRGIKTQKFEASYPT